MGREYPSLQLTGPEGASQAPPTWSRAELPAENRFVAF